MNDIDLEHLRSAISVAWQARKHGNHPFGAVLVDEHNHVLLQAENTVTMGRDSTGHAETNLVRLATQRFSPEQLAHHTLYFEHRTVCHVRRCDFLEPNRASGICLKRDDLYDIIGPSPEHLLLPCREVFARSQRPHQGACPYQSWKWKPASSTRTFG